MLSRIEAYFYTKRPDLKDKLLPQQVDMLRDLVDPKFDSQVESCGRGFGKTMLSACAALYFADEFSVKLGKPVNVLLISSQREIYNRIDEFFMHDESLKPRLRTPASPTSGYEIPREKFQFNDTHSTVYSCLPTVKQIRGIRADIIIFDEAQNIPEAIYHTALGCLKKDLIGKVVVIGTPYDDSGKGANWFVNIVFNPKKEKFHLSQYSSEQCVWNDVDRWKRNFTTARYKAEVLGEPPTAEERSFFPGKHVDACTLDVEAIREGGNQSYVELGLDPGLECFTAIFTERIGSIKRKVLDVLMWKEKPVQEVASELLPRILLWQPRNLKIDSKPPEYKKMMSGLLKKILLPVDAAVHKEPMLGQLQRRVREHQLIIPSKFIELIVQMKKYRRGMDRRDDLVDALAISCYEPAISLSSGQHGCVYGKWVTDSKIQLNYGPRRIGHR